MRQKADVDTTAGAVATPIYEVTGSDPGGRKFTERIKASDARAAAEQFRRQGCAVQSALLVSAVQGDRDCLCCGQSNGIDRIRCTSCRATLRGGTVAPTPRIELPAGYRAQRQSDGSLVVARIGWLSWRQPLATLLVVSFVLPGCGGLLLTMADAPDGAFIVLGVETATITLACFGWAIFASGGWIVTEGALRGWTRLFVRLRTQNYTDAAFVLKRQISRSPESGSPSHSSWCILLETLQEYVSICSETTPERARTIAKFLAQNTGWPLDDRVEGR